MFIALLMALSPAPGDQAEPEKFRDYMACVLSEAGRLSSSGEASEAVAKAAVFNCGAKLPAAAAAFRAASDGKLRALGWKVTSGQVKSGADDEQKIRAEAEEAANALVVESRLKAPAR